jgi:hypothetical protein
MGEAKTASVKYIFLDVVRYSQDRSVEAQTEIIGTLNELVRDSAEGVVTPQDRTVFLPTGDGICIGLLDVDSPYDIHLQLGLALLERLDLYNSQSSDPMRKFQIRVGINANVDNIVVDINGNRNVAGAGINLAQRVMNAADGNQILVGDAVFETLRHREKYMKSFKSFTANAKHGAMFTVHQFVEPHPGLDTSVPSRFRVAEKQEVKLSRFAAYYFAHGIKNREVLRSLPTRGSYWCYPATVLLMRLAQDSVGSSEANEFDRYDPRTWKAGKASFNEQLEYYKSSDFWVICDLSTFLEKECLSDYWEYFERSFNFSSHFVTTGGREKLKREWPSIWKEFGFEDTDLDQC